MAEFQEMGQARLTEEASRADPFLERQVNHLSGGREGLSAVRGWRAIREANRGLSFPRWGEELRTLRFLLLLKC